MAKTLVLGIGNTLLSDEGLGIHLLNLLARRYPDIPGVRYVDGGTLSFTLAPEVEDCDNLVVLDAARFGAEPGTVRLLTGAEMDAFIGRGRCSVHEVGLADLMAIARWLDRLPARRALLGIEPALFGWGETTSKAVACALPDAARQVARLLYNWQYEADNPDVKS